MITSIISRLVILLFGTLYPAYASYKAVRTKNVKEYVKWMMYWIVFALFTCIETFTDVFLSWFPFYYEIKIVLVVWLLSPATKGSSILYRKFVHPMLSSREQEIDEYITKAKEQSYRQVLDLGTKGVSALMQTAIKAYAYSDDEDFLMEVQAPLLPAEKPSTAKTAKGGSKKTGGEKSTKAAGTRKTTRKTNKEIKAEIVDFSD
ncbi:hypothetical protein NQ315_005295 [Exocentrus adspersus]|uniref:Receptor expression-enhancing protein n=1 Tax=Exocentrus adspersus TaxID=1586481 RepID=A0AAV8W2D4_9CUCU|nr:hypothetical protein NQ315_005295 [Exocentrus adspersus]